MAQLLAVSLPPGPRWWSLLDSIWSQGDVVLPIDHRLPQSLQRERVESMKAATWITPEGTERLPGHRDLCDGDALVILTSGSTGAPKGVILTHDALSASATIASRALHVQADDAWLSALPLAYIGGFSVLYRAKQWQLPLAFRSDLDQTVPPEVTLTSLVPKQLHDLDIAPFRKVLVGGAALLSKPPKNVLHTYGMSESAGGVIFNGCIPPEVTVTLEDSRILLDTPSRARAYRYSNQDERLPEGPLQTSDAGQWREDGRLEVLGRLDEVIITGGEKVWPSVVEAALNQAPGITGSLVYGIPDPIWGQRVCARIEAPLDTKVNALRERLHEHLPRSAIPKEFHLTKLLVRSPNGKILRPQP